MSPFQLLYDRLFLEVGNVTSILYIGCGDNAAFCKYLATKFPNAAVDNIDVCLSPLPRFLYMDARLPGVGRMLPHSSYDLIIDDVRDADYTIFYNMIPHVKKGGMYVIEYVNMKSGANVAATNSYEVNIYDYKPVHDDMVAVVRKK